MNRLDKLIYMFWVLILLSALVVNSVFAQSIKVGVILPLTGKLAKFGEIESMSFMMAAEEINALGGINGRKIELVIADTAGNRDTGRLAMKKLILEDRVIVIGGGCSSDVTSTAGQVAQHRKVPFLVNTASADEITEHDWEFVFRLNAPVSEYNMTLLSFLKKVTHVKTVAVLYENTRFGQYGLKKFSKLQRQLGLRVLLKQGYEAGAIDFTPHLIKVKKAKKPDLIYMISRESDASLLMRQAIREQGLNPRMFLGSTTGFTLPVFQENAGNTSEYVYSVTLWAPCVPYPDAKDFYGRFVQRYDLHADYHGAQAYAAVQVIADALRRAISLTPGDIRNSLAETDMMTVYGPVKFISYGKKKQQNSVPTCLVQWINGKLETVWPREVATAKYVYPFLSKQ